MARLSTLFDLSPISTSCLASVWIGLGWMADRKQTSVIMIGFLASCGSAAVGLLAGIPEPKFHDEFSYLLAADTFAHGRLTNPTHPMWVHFESFHIIQQPTYMSKYPPAQGLVLAAGQVIAGHPIVGVWLSFGCMCAAMCWMLYAWVPPRWALFGGFLAVINPLLGIAGYWAQSYWGGAVAATGGALVLGGVRRLMRHPRLYDALLTGIGLAVLVNSRPFEGLLVSLPAGIFLVIWIIRQRGQALRISIGRIVIPIFLVLTVTVAAMAVYNLRAVGNSFRIPYQIHENTYAMAPLFLWQKLPAEPDYRHQVIRDFHASYALPMYTSQRSIDGFLKSKVGSLLSTAFQVLNVFAIPLIAMFAVLVPWTLRNRWARRAALICLLLVSGLLVETFVLDHYVAPIAGLNYVFVLNAMRLWLWRNRRAGRFILWLVPLLAIVALGNSLYGRINEDGSSAWHIQRARLVRHLTQEGGKHLIIVSYGTRHSFHNEWVYNEADIDGGKVIFARQLDRVQDCKLVQYFRTRRIWSLELDDDVRMPELKAYPTSLCK